VYVKLVGYLNGGVARFTSRHRSPQPSKHDTDQTRESRKPIENLASLLVDSAFQAGVQANRRRLPGATQSRTSATVIVHS
jgi:hypothetical protein